jgi:hypothetical protein
MKNTLKIFIWLVVIFISTQFTYAELPWVFCKVQWKVIYSDFNTYIDDCYNINNVVIESYNKLYFLNSLSIINNECLIKKQKSIVGEITYIDIQSYTPKIWEIYNFKVLGASLVYEIPNSLIVSFNRSKNSFPDLKNCWFSNINKEQLSFDLKEINIIYKIGFWVVIWLILSLLLFLIYNKIKKQKK